MADKSKIEWTDATWNPIGGCTRVDEGCRNCYAEVMAARFSDPGQWGEGLAKRVTLPDGSKDHRWTGKVQLNEHALTKPLHWKKPRMIFVNSTSDLFHESIPDDWIDQVFAVMALCPQHTFQVLTKRPERAREYFRETAGWRSRIAEMLNDLKPSPLWNGNVYRGWQNLHGKSDGLPNVWLGTSVSEQASADLRIPHLLATPAAVRFVSYEPALGPVDFNHIKMFDRRTEGGGHETGWDSALNGKRFDIWAGEDVDGFPHLDWVICGGESGPSARPMHPDWARSVRDQCQAARVPFFFKQWGEWAPSTPDEAAGNPHSGWRCLAGHPHVARAHELQPEAGASFIERKGKQAAGRLLDGREWNEMPEDRL